MARLFSDMIKKAENKDGEIKERHAKIGQLVVESDFCHKGRNNEPRWTAWDYP